jgi:hypothetical protein
MNQNRMPPIGDILDLRHRKKGRSLCRGEEAFDLNESASCIEEEFSCAGIALVTN